MKMSEQQRIRFAEENIEDISDLYRAIGNIAWTPNFKLPKFSVFVESFVRMMLPSKKNEVLSPVILDWLDMEATENSIEQDDPEFFFSSTSTTKP